jgi:hypothetical protein
MTRPTCATCRHFEPDTTAIGQCHLNPPHTQSYATVHGRREWTAPMHHRVTPDSDCGQHAPRESTGGPETR